MYGRGKLDLRAGLEKLHDEGVPPMFHRHRRHGVASRVLGAGVPLKQIADILHHRSNDASMIYTKSIYWLAAVGMP